MERPRLLILSQTLPHPPDSGVKSRSANLFRQLAKAFDVTALCFYRRATLPPGGVEEAVRGLADLGRVEAFPIPQEHSRLRLLRDHAESLLGGRVYTVPMHRSAPLARQLRTLLADQRFALVHADSLDLSVWFNAVGGLPLVCGHHDLQSVLLARRAECESDPMRRWYVRLQAERMRAEEARWCPRVALNTVVSETDRQGFQTVAPEGRYLVVPNGMDLEYYRPASGPCEGLLFVGAAGWLPNWDAMSFYAEAIAPRLAGRADARLTWVGAVGREERHRLDGSGIVFTGHVPDTRPYLARAACCVVPLRMGSGTRIKILEAWAMGKAVVSTRVGAEGLEARDGENILLRDEPAAFAEAVQAVLDDSGLRARLGAAGRATVERCHDWERIGAAMNSAYLDLVRA
jgi:glycosyltransferase involved in cell wall biosynthesis